MGNLLRKDEGGEFDNLRAERNKRLVPWIFLALVFLLYKSIYDYCEFVNV